MLKSTQLSCLLQSFLLRVSSFSDYGSAFKLKTDMRALALTSVTEFGFEKITERELAVSEQEKKRCRKWYEENILCTNGTPAYDFTAGGKKFSKNPGDWIIRAGQESETGAVRKGGKTTYITLTHKKSGLVATVEATVYEENATCEWTVYIKNTGSGKSPVIKDFYAADCDIGTGTSTLYFSRGSSCSADDFELYKTPVSPTAMIFNANGGRSSSWLPYFNIEGKDFGAVMSVGWTGQWLASLRQKSSGVHIKAKQEYFKAYLNAGEQVRSPLVSMTFYEGNNALKGFNSFRKWERQCVYTDSAYPVTCTVIANEFDRRTADEFISFINSMSDEACRNTDFLWMDAGWYKINTNWYDSVGNWLPDRGRFPEGLKPVTDAAKKRGMNYLLWYEPERCCKNTLVYNECKKHERWLIEESENINMVNLAEDGACDFLANLVANSLKENGVALYRQDFNFTPLNMWRDADKRWYGRRTGIEENRYVTNIYRYLDILLEINPGLLIDNCASGGRRLDVEMSRRSIPLWRTDYNCADSNGKVKEDCLEATQAQTYGISFWMPLTGTGLSAEGEYADRSLITPCTQRPGYENIRKYMDRNYFPLACGGTDTKKYLAVQFGDGEEGAALVYRRSNCAEQQYGLVLNGLSPEASYEISDCDNPGSTEIKTGTELMAGGMILNIRQAPKCAIMLYKKV